MYLSSDFSDAPKVKALSDGAFRAYITVLSVMSRQNCRTYPTKAIRRFGAKPKHTRELVAAGLWRIDGDNIALPPSRWFSAGDIHPGPKRERSRARGMRKQILDRDGRMCVVCGSTGPLLHVDHIMPVSRHGLSVPENLQVLCAPCNVSKRDRTMEEWLDAWPG